MKLGVCYNGLQHAEFSDRVVFDGEELLEGSIQSIRHHASHVVVVYQTLSNFGHAARPKLEKLLNYLAGSGILLRFFYTSHTSQGLIDELVHYKPRDFTDEEKVDLVSKNCNPAEVGGNPRHVAPQFFNELTKREIGRQRCAAAGCSHFMSMDTDEFYKADQLTHAMRQIEEKGLDGTACKSVSGGGGWC